MAATVLDAQQLVDALVELVVAHGRDVETERVQRLDRRLIVESRGDQRAGADVVAGRDLERSIGVRRLKGLDLRGQVFHAAREGRPDETRGPRRWLQVAVEVVDRQQLDVHV